MLAGVVTHGGATKTAQAAYGELRLAAELFEKAAPHGGRAVKFLVSPPYRPLEFQKCLVINYNSHLSYI